MNVLVIIILDINYLPMAYPVKVYIQVFHEMKGDRDGKSAKTSATGLLVIICIPVPSYSSCFYI